MMKAYKYRIYPTKEQAKKIDHTINVCRLIYNLALETKIRAFKDCGVTLTAFDLFNQLPDLKKEYPWMIEVDSQALQAVIKNVDNAFKHFFNGKGYPRFKSKNGKQTFQCPNNCRKINWISSRLTIPRIKDIPIVLHRRFNGEIKNITIIKTPTGKYFAAVLVKNTDQVKTKETVTEETTIGLDVGINLFVVTSGGLTFGANRKLKESIARLKCLQRRGSRKILGSTNRKKVNKKVALLHERISNQRKDYIHKVTHALTHDNQVGSIVIEDLNVSAMLRNHKLAQAITDVSFAELFRQLEYKCEWYGKNLIQIGRFDPSSKRCSHCGLLNHDLKLNDRTWVCGCGIFHDRDINAARNIKWFGLEKYSRRGTPGEPSEVSAIVGPMKKETVQS